MEAAKAGHKVGFWTGGDFAFSGVARFWRACHVMFV
jgi:hypothetical protein